MRATNMILRSYAGKKRRRNRKEKRGTFKRYIQYLHDLPGTVLSTTTVTVGDDVFNEILLRRIASRDQHTIYVRIKTYEPLYYRRRVNSCCLYGYEPPNIYGSGAF